MTYATSDQAVKVCSTTGLASSWRIVHINNDLLRGQLLMPAEPSHNDAHASHEILNQPPRLLATGYRRGSTVLLEALLSGYTQGCDRHDRPMPRHRQCVRNEHQDDGSLQRICFEENVLSTSTRPHRLQCPTLSRSVQGFKRQLCLELSFGMIIVGLCKTTIYTVTTLCEQEQQTCRSTMLIHQGHERLTSFVNNKQEQQQNRGRMAERCSHPFSSRS